MPSDTYSALLGLLMMGTGNDNGNWGLNANENVFQILEDSIAQGLAAYATGGILDLSANPPPLGPNPARYAALIFTGILTSNQFVQVPNLQKFWFVKNATAGAFTLTMNTPGGTSSTPIPNNSGWQIVYCDGSNNIVVWPFNTNQIQMPNGSTSAPAFSWLQEPTSGWYRAQVGDFRFRLGGVDVLQVTSGGLSVNGGPIISAGNFIKGASGSVIAPGITFNAETSSGLYRGGAGDIGIALLGQVALEFTQGLMTWNGATHAGTDLSPGSIAIDQNDYNPSSNGLIRTFSGLIGGTGYVDGYYPNVPLIGGSGSGATANITVSGGVVTICSPQARGTGFVVANTLGALNTYLGGTGSGFSVNVGSLITLADATCLIVTPTQHLNITGIAGGSAGRELTVVNGGTALLTFPGQSASSSAANRFATGFTLAPSAAAALRYDAIASLWRVKQAATAPASRVVNLIAKNNGTTPSTKIDVTADEAVLVDTLGNAVKHTAVAVTIDSTTTGANGCDSGTRLPSTSYDVYLISNGVTCAGLITGEGNSPAMPAGYTFKKKVSWQHTDGSSNFVFLKQIGNEAAYTASPPTLAGGVAGAPTASPPTWATISLGGYVPGWAQSALIELGMTSAGNAIVAPNTSYGNYNATVNAPPMALSAGSGVTRQLGTFLLESSNIYWANDGSGGFVQLQGFFLPV